MKTLIPQFPKRQQMDFGVNMAMVGRVKCFVVDSKTKQVVREYPEQKNLILNQGMDNIASQYIPDEFLFAVAGTGTTPTSDDSGLTTAARSGTTVTLAGGAFTFTNTATDAGKMIKWDTAEEARIVTVTDATHCEVATSGTIAAAEFTVFRTNQTGLTTEVKRTNTYLTGSGNCGSTVNAGASTMSHKRTYDFSAEVGSVTYNEIGFSRVVTASNNLFSRILLGAGVSLVASQQLRVVYTLTITLSPTSPVTVGTSPITGASGATGQQQIQMPVMAQVNVSGGTELKPNGEGSNYGSSAFEPSAFGSTPNYLVYLCTVSTTFNAFGSQGPDRNSGRAQSSVSTGASYTSLSFTRTKTAVFTTGQGNGTTWRSIVLGGETGATANAAQGFVYILDSNFTKDNVHTLTLNLVLTWGRTLA